MRGKTYCRGCNSKTLFEAIDLGFSPLANGLLREEALESPETWYPLILRICETCGLGQVGEFVSESEIFRDYPYLSSTSSTWLESNRNFANQISKLLDLSKDDLVVELASNDGYLLKMLSEGGINVLGVEPALNVATLASLIGIPTSPEFFTQEYGTRLASKGVSPRLIVAKNVVAHVPDIRDFISGIEKICGLNTLVVIEAPTILNIIQGNQFDTVYHEHFSYLSATFFKNVLADFELQLIGVERLKTHGGSIRFYISRMKSKLDLPQDYKDNLELVLEQEESVRFTASESWVAVRKDVEKILDDFRYWLTSSQNRLIGYGAAAKAVTFLSSAQAPRDVLTLCIDNSEEKKGRFLPGSHTKIVSEDEYIRDHKQKDDTFIIFPWNLEVEIAARIRAFSPAARVFVGLPHLREV